VLPKLENVYDMATKDFSAVIMAAGHSRRMGRPKMMLPYDRHQSFVERGVNVLSGFGCAEIAIVVNIEGMNGLAGLSPAWPDCVRAVVNPFPEKGRFLSLQTGLSGLKKNCPVFIHNVDNPFVDGKVLHLLASHAGRADYIRPVCDGKPGHPVLISARVASDIVLEKKGEGHVRDYLAQYAQHFVRVNDPAVLVNINTLEEYKKYFPE